VTGDEAERGEVGRGRAGRDEDGGGRASVTAERLVKRGRWVRRIVAALVLVVLLGWFGRFAYLRITTPPALRADAEYGGPVEPLPGDVTAELLEIVAKLPPPPPFSEPPPAGMQWVFGSSGRTIELSDVVRGPWNLEERPMLRAAVAYLSSPAVSEAVEKLRALRGRPWRYKPDAESWDAAFRAIPQGIWDLLELLVAHARYVHAELGAPHDAREDLGTALWLTQPDARWRFTGYFYTSRVGIALDELMCMAGELVLDDAIARDLEREVRALPDFEASWLATIHDERVHFEEVIQKSFTDDGTGNGWLVLSEQENASQSTWSYGGWSSSKSTLWNLSSPLYHDRRRTMQTLGTYLDWLEAMTDRSPSEAMRSLVVAGEPFDPRDGPALWLGGSARSQDMTFKSCLRASAQRSATLMVLAAERFEAERGKLPASPEDLVPEYLAEVPKVIDNDDLEFYYGQSYPQRFDYTWERLLRGARPEPIGGPRAEPLAPQPNSGGGGS